MELTKILHVHFYIVSKTEKIQQYQLCRHNTKCVHADNTLQVYILVALSLLCLL